MNPHMPWLFKIRHIHLPGDPMEKDLYSNEVQGQDIFCDIVAGRAKGYRVYEDHEFLGLLDIFPNIKGMTIVIPKEHKESYPFDLDDGFMARFFSATKKVAKLLEEKLGVKRVHLVIEGTGINHLHAKLYPAIGLESKRSMMIADERVFFERYMGYVTTLSGPRALDEELEKLRKQIAGR